MKMFWQLHEIMKHCLRH